MPNQVLEQISDKVSHYDRRAKETLADATRSQEYRAELVSKLYDKATREAQELLEKEAARLADNLRNARAEIRRPKLAGSKDPATLQMAYRDAQRDVKDVKTISELREAFYQAEAAGDELQAQYLAMHKAVDLGDGKTLQEFLEVRPDFERAYERYMAAAEEWNSWERESLIAGLSRFKRPSEYGLQNQA